MLQLHHPGTLCYGKIGTRLLPDTRIFLHLSPWLCSVIIMALSKSVSFVLELWPWIQQVFRPDLFLIRFCVRHQALAAVSPLLNSDFAMTWFGTIVSVILIASDYLTRTIVLYLEQRDMPLVRTHVYHTDTQHTKPHHTYLEHFSLAHSLGYKLWWVWAVTAAPSGVSQLPGKCHLHPGPGATQLGAYWQSEADLERNNRLAVFHWS